MARSIGVAPTKDDLNQPKTTTWFKEATDRFKIYAGASDPTSSDIPDGQWFWWRNTSTSVVSLWANYGGTLTNLGVFSPSTTGTGTTYVLQTSPSLITPALGVATGTSLAVTGSLTSTGGGIGYATGAGGTVTQLTNKSTAVTLNKLSGQITMNAALLANGRAVSFTLNNTFITAGDVISVGHTSGGTVGAYMCSGAGTGTGTGQLNIANLSGSGLSEAVVLTFAVIKSVSS